MPKSSTFKELPNCASKSANELFPSLSLFTFHLAVWRQHSFLADEADYLGVVLGV